MANVYAVKSGNWSDTTVWNTGALPTSEDDVWANTFTVAANTTTTVLSIRNGSTTNVTAGGGFTAVNGVTLTLTGAGVVASTVTCYVSSLTTGQSATIAGAVTGGGSPSAFGASNASTGTLNITGNVAGSSASSSHGASNGSTGTLNITGNVTGGSGGTAHGVNNNSTGTVNITGNVTGASATNASGANNNSTGVLNITGNITGGSTGAGAINVSTGTLTHVGTAQSTNAAAAVTGSSFSQVTILSGPFLTSSNGANPVYCTRWFWANSNLTSTYYQIRTANQSTIRPLYTADSVGGNPAITNVRSGTVYGPNDELTGTCAVPPAGSVALGVPVDNTTGTAVLTQANFQAALDAQGLTSARAAKLDNLDAAVSSRLATSGYTAPPTSVQNAQAVRTELSTELGRIDTTVSSRLASASYTAPPTPTQNASAVRTELTTELTRIDTTVSSRSTFNPSTDTVANVTLVDTTTNLTNPPDVPTTIEIADAVRVELTPELNNLDVAVSTRSTFNPATDTVARVTLVDTTTDLTNPPVVPTPEQIATAVRTELEPELERIDVDVSTRLAAVDYEQAPTSEQNAEAVRVELTPELERVANCATVATTGEQIQDAWARSPSTP